MSESMTRRQMLLRSSAAFGGAILAGCAGTAGKMIPETARNSGTAVRMMFNENPYGPSETAQAAMTMAFNEANLYVRGAINELRTLIADQVGLTRDHILIGSGSTEILQVVALVSGLNGGEIIAADPTFQALNRYAENIGGTVHRVPVNETLALDLEAMKKKVNKNTKLIYVCNPNNPTATIVSDKKLRPFCEEMSKQTLILVDEAYYEYVDNPKYHTLVDLVSEGHNVIVTRTASKIHGLAGLRIGFGIAQPELVKHLQKRLTGTLNIIGLRAALASYRDKKFQSYCFKKNQESKAIVYKALRELNFRYLESETNFIFFQTGVPIEQFQKDMEGQGFLVGRPFPPYLDWCRLSMAQPHEMRKFAAVLQNVMT